MTVELRPMTLWDCWRVIPWRNACRAHLRTPTDDTRWSQFRFWLRVIRNPDSPHRYWSVYQGSLMVGMVGLCNGRPSTCVEISLITDPSRRGQGIGRAAWEAALEVARQDGYLQVWGEVYATNPAVSFWRRLTEERRGEWRDTFAGRGSEVTGHWEIVPAYYFEVCL